MAVSDRSGTAGPKAGPAVGLERLARHSHNVLIMLLIMYVFGERISALQFKFSLSITVFIFILFP